MNFTRLFSGIIFGAVLMLALTFANKPKGVTIGALAPNFTADAVMADNTVKTVQLSDYAGQWILLFFYPKDETHICPTELQALHNDRQRLEEMGITVLPISMDSAQSHIDWREELEPEFAFDWLSDPTGKVTHRYGAYNPQEKMPNRATYLISPEGILEASIIYNTNVGRNTDEIFRMIEATQAGGLCGVNWEKGDEFIDPNASENE